MADNQGSQPLWAGMKRAPRSHGTGQFKLDNLAFLGERVIIEKGVLIFHPEVVHIEDGVYVGHQTILKGYYLNSMKIGAGTWIGQQCFFHSAGGLIIEEDVGIGPGVKILTSTHDDPGRGRPIMAGKLALNGVVIGAGSDIGVGVTILPGVHIGKGVQVGAGAVVTSDLPDFSVALGVPAKVIRFRE